MDQRERVLLQRLSAFAGSFTLEAAESCSRRRRTRRHSVLDALIQLTEKSLVVLEQIATVYLRSCASTRTSDLRERG